MVFDGSKIHRKGIILAGGKGTRLYPLTQVISKQLIAVYDKPMIYYPLSVLMLAGIKEILIINTPDDAPLFKRQLGGGEKWGLNIQYAIQPSPDGIAQSLIIAEEFLHGDPSALILGDNIFYGHGLTEFLTTANQQEEGAVVFAYWVKDPQRYGVIEYDKDDNITRIIEKPAVPPSNYAVTGLYFYDGQAPGLARSLKPSARGELEITDLNNVYLEKGQLKSVKLGRGFAWLDTGNPAALLQAANFVQTVEERQGLKICCPEEIAYSMGHIDRSQLAQLANELKNTDYGDYLSRLALGVEG